MYVQCGSTYPNEIGHSAAMRSLAPLSAWLLARARHAARVPQATTFGPASGMVNRFNQTEIDPAWIRFRELQRWQLEHPPGVVRCEAGPEIVTVALAFKQKALLVSGRKFHQVQWKPLRLVLEVKESAIRARGDAVVLEMMQQLAHLAWVIAVVDVVCTGSPDFQVPAGFITVPGGGLPANHGNVSPCWSHNEGDIDDHASSREYPETPSARHTTPGFEAWLRSGVQQDLTPTCGPL